MPGKKTERILSIRNLPIIVISALMIFYCITDLTHKAWKESEGPERGVIRWDVIPNYSYLPAIFIYHDLGLDFTDEPGFNNDNKFWYREANGTGKKVIIGRMGLSYLYAPFFFMAHLLAPVLEQDPDGFQPVYQFFLVFSALFYLGIGFYCLWKFLSRYFTRGATAITLLLIGLGSNLYYFSTYEAALIHSYSFALISALMLLLVKYFEQPDNWKRCLLAGFIFGLVVLVRPLNLLLLAPLAFLEIKNLRELGSRFSITPVSVLMILLFLVAFLAPWIPQLIYWKKYTGQMLFNIHAGTGERYFFDNPHILDFLFSYRKGWFIYTPLMLLSLMGLMPLYRFERGLFYPVLASLLLMIYLLSSWWSWWYGGSFGMRPMIDFYGLLAIPLAALIQSLGKRNQGSNIAMAVMLVFLLFLNIFQTYQYRAVLIHWNSMTRESYWTIFLRSKDRFGYWQNLREPDLELARKGIYVSYPVTGKDERLMEMEKEDGLRNIQYQIRKDRRLIMDIKRYSRRTGTERLEALDMVVERVYGRMTE